MQRASAQSAQKKVTSSSTQQKSNAHKSDYATSYDYYQQKILQRQHVTIPEDEKVDNSHVRFNYFDYIDRPREKGKKKKGKRSKQ